MFCIIVRICLSHPNQAADERRARFCLLWIDANGSGYHRMITCIETTAMKLQMIRIFQASQGKWYSLLASMWDMLAVPTGFGDTIVNTTTIANLQERSCLSRLLWSCPLHRVPSSGSQTRSNRRYNQRLKRQSC